MAIEIEEPTLFENILQYGLFAAAIFQIICIMAAIFIPKSESEQVMWHRTFDFKLGDGRPLRGISRRFRTL